MGTRCNSDERRIARRPHEEISGNANEHGVMFTELPRALQLFGAARAAPLVPFR